MPYAELWVNGQAATVMSRDKASGLNLQLVFLVSATYLKFECQKHKYLNTVIGREGNGINRIYVTLWLFYSHNCNWARYMTAIIPPLIR